MASKNENYDQFKTGYKPRKNIIKIVRSVLYRFMVRIAIWKKNVVFTKAK